MVIFSASTPPLSDPAPGSYLATSRSVHGLCLPWVCRLRDKRPGPSLRESRLSGALNMLPPRALLPPAGGFPPPRRSSGAPRRPIRVRSGASEPPAASEPPSASEQPTGWSAALEAAQARAAALRASSLGAASAAQAAAEAAVKHPLGAKVMETSGNAWSALPPDFRLHAPTAAAAALAFTTVALVLRESNKGNEKLSTALQPPKCALLRRLGNCL